MALGQLHRIGCFLNRDGETVVLLHADVVQAAPHNHRVCQQENYQENP